MGTRLRVHRGVVLGLAWTGFYFIFFFGRKEKGTVSLMVVILHDTQMLHGRRNSRASRFLQEEKEFWFRKNGSTRPFVINIRYTIKTNI